MKFLKHALQFSLITGLILAGQVAAAQSEIRRGVLPMSRLADWENQSEITLSTGMLPDLESDPNFSGDYQSVYDMAAQILNGYTVVNRAGYFPENAGIPRENQLARAQAVYYFYLLPNSNGLILYRSPEESTARYMIRKPGVGFCCRSLKGVWVISNHVTICGNYDRVGEVN